MDYRKVYVPRIFNIIPSPTRNFSFLTITQGERASLLYSNI